MHYLAEFEIVTSRCGLPTAIHVPSNTLLHSRVNPWKEAREIAAQHLSEHSRSTLIVGGGLGYLPEALLEAADDHHIVYVIEPDSDLRQLALRSRPNTAYATSPRVKVITVSVHCTLAAIIRAVPVEAQIIISPYLLRLTEHKNFPLSGFLRITRAELASRTVYNPLLCAHGNTAGEKLSGLPSMLSETLPQDKLTVVAGAGPSLNACFKDLSAFRSQITVLSASGAVPSLLAARIIPDWTFALEAQDAVLKDLTDLPLASRVVVFPATHPDVFASNHFTLFAGTDAHGAGLETRGGSSAIPAVDFALRASLNDVALVGMDLSYYNGAYAEASKRPHVAALPMNPLPPKFLAMRAGVERVLLADNHRARAVLHVLLDGMPVKRAKHISPEGLHAILSQRFLCEVQCE